MTRAIKSLDYFAVLMFLIVSIHYVGDIVMPRVEGRVFPVVRPATLESFTMQPPPPWRTIWTASASKVRSCKYIVGSLKWYYGLPSANNQQVVARFEDPPKIRSMGVLHWDGLVVDLDPTETRLNSFATVRHQCAWRWWETESVFYKPPNAKNK